jgi:hypothetical protein
MFEKIEDYILKDISSRQSHIDLKEKCIEIGGFNSTYYKGLLAHCLKTTIPTLNKNIQLCHLCGNSKCSNPNHLYWGTRSENENDKKIHGTFKSLRELTIQKHGLEKANKIFKKASSSGGKKGGGSNKLRADEIEERLKKIEFIDFSKKGSITKASIILNVSHTQIKRFLDKYTFIK